MKAKSFPFSFANRSCCACIAPNNTGDLGRLALGQFFRVIEYVLILISLEQLAPSELREGEVKLKICLAWPAVHL